MKTSNNTSNKVYGLSFFWLILLISIVLGLPTFHNQLGSTGAIFVNGALIVFLSIHFIKTRITSFYEADKFILCYFTLYFFLIALSAIVGTLILGHEFGERDIFEIHRPIFAGVVIAYGVYLGSVNYHKVRVLMRLTTIGVVLFACLYLISISSDFKWVLELYTKRHNVISYRMTAPFVSPYDMGLMALLLIIYWICLFVQKEINLPIFFILIIFLSMVIFLTQSRMIFLLLLTTLLVFLGIFFLHFLFNLSVPRRIFGLGSITIIMAMIFAVIIWNMSDQFSYLILGLQNLIEGQGLGKSTDARFQQFRQVMSFSNGIWPILFGNGPAKSTISVIESGYFYVYFRYGFFGVFLILLIPLFFALISLWKNFGRILSPGDGSTAVFCSIAIIVFSLANFSNNFFDQIRLSFFFYLYFGLLISLAPFGKFRL